MSFHYPSKDAATAAVYDAAILLLEAPLKKPLPQSVRNELWEITYRASTICTDVVTDQWGEMVPMIR